MKSNSLPFLGGILIFSYFLFYLDFLIVTSIGIAFSFFIFLDFLNKMGKVLPIKEFITLIAALQWVVGAKISYSIGKVHYKYYMYVDEETYMNYVVPGLILMYLGFILFKSELSLSAIEERFALDRKRLKQDTSILIGTGMISTFLGQVVTISALAFFLYLLSLLLYVGVGYLFYLYPKRKTFLMLITLGFLFITSLSNALFHNLFLLGSFLLLFYFSKGSTLSKKLLIFVFGFCFIYIIQVVKKDLRDVVWSGSSSESSISIFYGLIQNEFLGGGQPQHVYSSKSQDDDDEANVNTRINQGWIISKIMEHVPKNEDYLGASSIIESIKSSLLPRFLAPNKRGGDAAKIDFERATGLELVNGTSMGLSLIGEFYASFGVSGGWIAMFIYGVFISLIIRFILLGLGKGSPIIILWFILFFFQVVKAESNFISVINHLVKTILFFYIIRFILLQFNVFIFQREQKTKMVAHGN